VAIKFIVKNTFGRDHESSFLEGLNQNILRIIERLVKNIQKKYFFIIEILTFASQIKN